MTPVAEIALFSGIDKPLHYTVPEALEAAVRPGVRVMAPLGRRQATGLVLAVLDRGHTDIPEGVALKPLSRVLDAAPVVPPDLLELFRWIASYYFYPPGEVLSAALPSGMGHAPDAIHRLTEAGVARAGEEKAPRLLRKLLERDGATPDDLLETGLSAATIRKHLNQFEAEGLVQVFYEASDSEVGPKLIRTVSLIQRPPEAAIAKNENLHAIVDALDTAGGSIPLRSLRHTVKGFDYWVKKLVRDGFAEFRDTEEIRESAYAQTMGAGPPFKLTPEQRDATEAIRKGLHAGVFQPFLLHGVTGSGKTEIYLSLAEEAVAHDRGVLVLTPEIALSTQMEAVFRNRFGKDLAVWHSALSPGARFDQWREALEGRRKIVLGVRSAVFMPVRNLGLIIVDEEHDSAYKQEDRLRYHARDVALMRGRLLRIPVLLGSATPSLQSMHMAAEGRAALLTMERRVLDRPFPAIEVVDMRREKRAFKVLSQPLQEALKETVQDGKQALLFLNRRGFATFLLCQQCGNVVQCASCSVSMTYHQGIDRLRCHYCGMESPLPEVCPACGRSALRLHGFGTERVEEEVKRVVPGVRTRRIDRDATGEAKGLLEALNAVREGKVDVVVGTQMVTKGHDFPNITLVGVVNADTALQLPDFRAGEMTVQLLMQVTGRAGRGEDPGRAILQSYNPDHYTMEAVLRMDYAGFAETELVSRRMLQYPPFARLVRFLVTAKDEKKAVEAAWNLTEIAREIAAELKEAGHPVALVGPSPAPLLRLKDRFRWHLFAKAWLSQDLQRFGERLMERARQESAIRSAQLSVDRDPLVNL